VSGEDRNEQKTGPGTRNTLQQNDQNSVQTVFTLAISSIGYQVPWDKKKGRGGGGGEPEFIFPPLAVTLRRRGEM